MEKAYETWNPTSQSMDMVRIANLICAEYQSAGYDLTLRQLYYQFVARDLIPNTQRSYKNLGSIINRARMAGMLNWDYIVDRTRNVEINPHWVDASDIIQSSARQFKLDRWENQHYRVEVWIEKDALIGVIEGVCENLDVPYFSCRGYTSQSEMWGAAQRHLGYEAEHDADGISKDTVIIHLGDHDPSGIDMTRDIQERLRTFGTATNVERIALNMNQVEQYDPPPNPTKLTDSRAQQYILNFGYDSWELDALEPVVLNDLVRDTVLLYRDEDVHRETMEEESEIVEGLTRLASVPWERLRIVT